MEFVKMTKKYYCNRCKRYHRKGSKIYKKHIKSKNPGRPKRPKFKYGDFINLNPNAKVYLSTTGEQISPKIIEEDELWAVDYYEESTGMLNINRVLEPYPGAYCSWVNEKYVIKS